MKSDLPLVSVLMPLYNKQAYVAEAITSVLNQTYPNIELIIIDDGSTDGSFEVAIQFISSKVQVFKQENRGVSAARNVAFKHSKGDFIQYLDADDVLESQKLAEQVNILRGQNEPVLVTAKRYYFKENVDNHWQLPNMPILEKNYDNNVDFLLDEVSSSAFVHSWLIPRALIVKAGNWHESMTIFEDRDFYLRLVFSANQIIYSPNSICYCRFPMGDHQAKRSKKSDFGAVLDYFSRFEHQLLHGNQDLHSKCRSALACLYKKLLNIADDKKTINELKKRSVRLGLVPDCSQSAFIELCTKALGIKNTFRLIYLKSKYIDTL